LSSNTAFCSHASNKNNGRKFWKLKPLIQSFQILQKKIFGKKVKSYVENPIFFLGNKKNHFKKNHFEIKRTTLNPIFKISIDFVLKLIAKTFSNLL
jgi:hypothetical protein